ncbi:hypothetical protein B0H14DRAFT_2600762 [Mycena olivaceomarginata]|nr:hypothetical protein B0H14DRAFT_2600762 [Mycena olivaceomarginata]
MAKLAQNGRHMCSEAGGHAEDSYRRESFLEEDLNGHPMPHSIELVDTDNATLVPRAATAPARTFLLSALGDIPLSPRRGDAGWGWCAGMRTKKKQSMAEMATTPNSDAKSGLGGVSGRMKKSKGPEGGSVAGVEWAQVDLGESGNGAVGSQSLITFPPTIHIVRLPPQPPLPMHNNEQAQDKPTARRTLGAGQTLYHLARLTFLGFTWPLTRWSVALNCIAPSLTYLSPHHYSGGYMMLILDVVYRHCHCCPAFIVCGLPCHHEKLRPGWDLSWGDFLCPEANLSSVGLEYCGT